MNKIYAFFILLLFGTISYSQNQIKGNVIDSTGAPVSYCAMVLLNAKDSLQVKGNITDSAGYFVFEKIRGGDYFIKFNAVGFNSTSTPTFSIDSLSQIQLATITLKTEGVNLKEVSVAVYKPAVEFKKGMVVLNVEDDIIAKGNTVLDLVRRIPGVMVDAQNNISVNGVPDVRFMIDERLQQMPNQQVADMLQGMSADAVSKIELIKNPPAKYDAAGAGGLINIVTKKAKVKGYNGNVAFGASCGEKWRWGPAASFNYKANKLSIFSNFSYGHWDGISHQKLERTVTSNGNTETINSYGTNESWQSVFSGSGGIEYDITPKTLIGIYANGNTNDDHYLTDYTTGIGNSTFFNFNKTNSQITEKFDCQSPNYNFSLLQKIDSTGGQIKFTAGYSNYLERLEKNMSYLFYDNNDIEVATPSKYTSNGKRNFDVYNGKLDFNKTFKNKLSIESGVKANWENDYNKTNWVMTNQSTGFFVGDTSYTINYKYRERVLAAYTTLSANWEKFGFSIGLRAEETDVDNNYISSNYHYKRNYLNFFPSGSLDFNLNKKNSVTIAYSYRIRRPHSGMLNPVRQFNDQLNYGVGNPEIIPQYSHHMNIDYNYNQFITVSAGYDYANDFTFYYTYTPQNSRVNIDTVSNLPRFDNGYINLSAQKRIKWYSFQTYIIGQYQAFYGQLINQDVSSQTYSCYFNLNQEFYLPKDFKIAIWAGRGSEFKHGPQTYHARSAIHINVDKAFFNKKLNITLGIQDILFKDYFSYTHTYQDQTSYWYDRMDTRRIRIRISYRFGKMQIQQRLGNEGGGVNAGK